MLEINGMDVVSKSYRETNKLLSHHYQQGTSAKIVVARPFDSIPHDTPLYFDGVSSAASAEQPQALNTSLNTKLEFQTAEVEHWKQEYTRYASRLQVT